MFMLLGLVIASIAFILFKSSVISIPVAITMAVVGALIAYWQLFFPKFEYEDAVLTKEWELVPIIPEANVYAIKVQDEEVIYKFKNFDENNEEMINYIRYTNYEINESEDGKGYLRFYEQKQKKSIWYNPFAPDKIKYVLSLPKDGKVLQ